MTTSRVNGQTISEHDETGAWTDYITANGEKIAMVQPVKTTIHVHGVQTRMGSAATPGMSMASRPG